jgi:AraC-like DNA-binding protein
MRLIRPFLKVFGKDPKFRKELLDPLWQMDPDDRMPIAVALELMRGGIEITGDPNIGLKAAAEVERGDYGVLEYVARSAPTIGAATEVLGRYLALVNDALRFTHEVKDGRAIIRFESTIVLPRSSADFQSAAFFWATRLLMDEQSAAVPVDIWFEHAQPDDISEYKTIFGDNKVLFGMPNNGFTFPAELLEAPLPSADDKLHALIRKHADGLIAELPRAQSFTQKVRELLLKELEDEGTTFKDLLDDLRKSLSLRYVGSTDLGLSEIAFLLGFSQSAAFHRAFKRWTAQTPLEYRRARRG